MDSTRLDATRSADDNDTPSGVFPVAELPAHADAQADDGQTNQAVAALRSVAGGSSLQAALEAGEIIFLHVFNGDPSRLRARGKKCSSFRKLAAHPGLSMSTSSLWRAVAIYELSLRFAELPHYIHVGVGHISVVLGLPPVEQFRLLRRAESERWTRRKLQKVVAEVRLAQRTSGSLPSPKVLEQLAGVEMLVGDAAELGQQLSLMTTDEVRHALDTMRRIQQRCGVVEGQLRGACEQERLWANGPSA